MFKKIFDRLSKQDEDRTDGTGDPGSAGAETGAAAKAGGPMNTDALSSFAEQKEAEKARRRAEAEAGPPEEGAAPADGQELVARIEEALRTVYDPEIPVNIYDIGLIYEITPKEHGMVYVKMTLTSPSCPAAGILPGQVESRVRSVEGVRDVELELTFDPPWTPEMMADSAKLELGLM